MSLPVLVNGSSVTSDPHASSLSLMLQHVVCVPPKVLCEITPGSFNRYAHTSCTHAANNNDDDDDFKSIYECTSPHLASI